MALYNYFYSFVQKNNNSMKKVLIIAATILITNSLFAEIKPFKVKFFPSINFGIFTNPSDVNTYIVNDLSDYIITSGTSDVILNFNLGLGVGFRFYNIVEVQPIFEYSLGPKIILGAKSYNFNKSSAGIMTNFMIPLNSERKHSIIVGGGAFYNMITFEEYSGNTIAPRAQLGYSINNNKFNPQIIIAYDMANAKADTADENGDAFMLNYSSVRIGINLCF